MTYKFENEVLAAVFSLLSGDSELATSTGISPQDGTARNVAVYNQVRQNATMPYVRITVTDTMPLQDETYDFSKVTAKTVSLLVDAFSDYEPECRAIASRLETLLENAQVSTDNLTGASWHRGTTFFVDNTSDPNKLIQRASMRLRVNMTVS